jgi:hypothetical protein
LNNLGELRGKAIGSHLLANGRALDYITSLSFTFSFSVQSLVDPFELWTFKLLKVSTDLDHLFPSQKDTQ